MGGLPNANDEPENILQQYKEIVNYGSDYMHKEITELLHSANTSDLVEIVNEPSLLPWNVVNLSRRGYTKNRSVRKAIGKLMPRISNLIDEYLGKDFESNTMSDFDTIFVEILDLFWNYRSPELRDVLRKHTERILRHLDNDLPNWTHYEEYFHLKYSKYLDKLERKLFELAIQPPSLEPPEPTPDEIDAQLSDMNQVLQEVIIASAKLPFEKPIFITTNSLANKIILMKWSVHSYRRTRYQFLFNRVRSKCSDLIKTMFYYGVPEHGYFGMQHGDDTFEFSVNLVTDFKELGTLMEISTENLMVELLQSYPSEEFSIGIYAHNHEYDYI